MIALAQAAIAEVVEAIDCFPCERRLQADSDTAAGREGGAVATETAGAMTVEAAARDLRAAIAASCCATTALRSTPPDLCSGGEGIAPPETFSEAC